MSLISSSPDERKRKPRERKRDHRGDDRGILEPAPEGGNTMRDDIVSARWVVHAIRQNPVDYADLEAEGEDFAELLESVGEDCARHAAMALAFPVLWRVRKGRVTAGELLDLGDLFAAGRGTVEQIVGDLLGGRYTDARRDGEGFLILAQDGDTP
jgi:hypothetical protein